MMQIFYESFHTFAICLTGFSVLLWLFFRQDIEHTLQTRGGSMHHSAQCLHGSAAGLHGCQLKKVVNLI